MSLYALGDLHLSFGNPEKSMDRFGRVWRRHEKKIEKAWKRMVTDSDTIVLTGDFSWAKNLEGAKDDFDFLLSLPGRKVMVRGNHDMFWDAKKTDRLNDLFAGRLFFLQNNFTTYTSVTGTTFALCGTKGICFENLAPFEIFLKLEKRESARLRTSLELADKAGYAEKIIFLHYPPTSTIWPADAEIPPEFERSPLTDLAEEYGVKEVVYSHSHGAERFSDSLHGMVRGTCYNLVSGDYLNFVPLKIMD